MSATEVDGGVQPQQSDAQESAALARLAKGSAVLLAFSAIECKLDFVPSAYPNGTPNHPSRLYVHVSLPAPLPQSQHNYMRGLGWVAEDDGYEWLLYA